MLAQFFYLEGAYLIFMVIVLVVTLFITTRPFMSKSAPKTGLLSVFAVFSIAILLHFWTTTSRMAEVKVAFHAGSEVLCENKMIRKGAQFITISKRFGWSLEGDDFVSANYSRSFFTARCIVK